MIGVFDSGFGGLTILRSIRRLLPQYDYLYLGDNARTPYGSRSFEVVYEYTLQAVRYLFSEGCSLVILACNTASAKALRSIQQRDLPLLWNDNPLLRVLGIIRPTAEIIGQYSATKHIGVLATQGTVASESYLKEIEKQSPLLTVTQQACPMWVPLVENAEHTGDGADYFVRKYIDEIMHKDPHIDTLLLACTHYPLLEDKIRKYLPSGVRLLEQGDIVANSLKDYLQRHTDLDSMLSKNSLCRYLTTESPRLFAQNAGIFLNQQVTAQHIELTSF